MRIGIALLVAFLLATVPPAAAQSNPVKIGVFMPLSGSNGPAGNLELKGILLAHKLMPSVLGRPVQLVILDTKSDPVEAAKAVSTLVSNEVTAILGAYGSSDALAGGEVAERARIPVMGTSCSSPLVTQGRKFYFRTAFLDAEQAKAAALYAKNELKCSNVAVLTNMSHDPSVGLAAYFKREFRQAGGKIVADLRYESGETDFTPQVEALMEAKPDVVFVASYVSEGINFLRALGTHPPFYILGTDAFDHPDLPRLAPASVQKLLHTAFPYDSTKTDSSESAKFTSQWEKTYPDAPPSTSAAVGYTSYVLLHHAITHAGDTSSEAIAMALSLTANVPTPLGKLSIDAFHDADTRVAVVGYPDGKRRILHIYP